MNVKVVDKLGDIVAYKPNEVQVIKGLYDKVPSEFRSDFESVLITARESYFRMVKESKDKGEKPKSAAIKKQTISSIIEPFLNRHNIIKSEVVTRVYKTENPRIPADGEIPVVTKNVAPRVRKQTIVSTNVDRNKVSELFDKFDPQNPDASLSSMTQISKVSVNPLTEGLFEDSSETLDEFDGVDFEGLLQ